MLELNSLEKVIQQEKNLDWELSNQDDGALFAKYKNDLKNNLSSAFGDIEDLNEAEIKRINEIFGLGSTIENNNNEIGTAFSRRTEFTQQIDEVGIEKSEEELEEEKRKKIEEEQRKRDEELQKIQNEVNDAMNKFEKMIELTKTNTDLSKQLEGKLQSMDEEIKKLTEQYKVAKKTNDFMSVGNADANIKKLQAIIQQSSNRILTLAQDWENIRGPLLAKLKRIQDKLNEKSSSRFKSRIN